MTQIDYFPMCFGKLWFVYFLVCGVPDKCYQIKVGQTFFMAPKLKLFWMTVQGQCNSKLPKKITVHCYNNNVFYKKKSEVR